LGITGFKGRKTGLFKPVWERVPDAPEQGEREKGLFYGPEYAEVERRSGSDEAGFFDLQKRINA
jgi:hypothetical protein